MMEHGAGTCCSSAVEHAAVIKSENAYVGNLVVSSAYQLARLDGAALMLWTRMSCHVAETDVVVRP